MPESETLVLEPGSKKWKEWRKLATEPIPGERSALYFLNAKILGKEPLIPMTYRAHLAMCLFAESATGIPEVDNARVKMILVPRDLGKSSLVTKGRPIQKIIQDRNYAIGIANEADELAKTFLGDIKNEFEQNALLRTLFPECIPDNTRETIWKADEIIVKRDKLNPTSPSVLATGVTGTITGRHQDMFICDDLLSQKAAEAARRGNMEEIEKVNRWIGRLQPLLKNPKSDEILFIGTRWWEGDSYEFVEEYFGHGQPRRKFKWTLKLPPQTLSWDYDRDGVPERVERPAERQHLDLYVRDEVAIFSFPARDENGRSVFPERYNAEELEKMQIEDPDFFSGQFLLDPTAGGTTLFETEWLNYYIWEGDRIRFTGQDGKPAYRVLRDLTFFISVDPAFSKKSSAARTAIPVTATDGTHLFLFEDFAERMESEDDIAAKVVEFWLRYPNVSKVFVETIVAQVAVANAIRRRFREEGLNEPPLEELKRHSEQNKIMRIYGMEHYAKRGLLYIHRSHTKFVEEYSRFPKGRLRDILDAIAFQIDEWERVFKMQRTQGTINPRERMAAEATAIERVKRATSTWRRRRR